VGATVRFSLRRQDRVILEVFDLAGRRVTKRDLGVLDSGEHEVPWGERDGGGATIARGVYFARLRGTGWSVDQKVTVLR
jgi:hypothetical protein